MNYVFTILFDFREIKNNLWLVLSKQNYNWTKRLTSIKIYSCITKYRIEKTNPYLKYSLNHKNSFLFVRFRLNIRKASYSTKESNGSEALTLCDNSGDLKIIFSLVFFNLNVAKLKNSRLLLNRCQSLCQKGFVCVLIKLLYKACSSISSNTAKLFSNF